jgi:hypothetical protein
MNANKTRHGYFPKAADGLWENRERRRWRADGTLAWSRPASPHWPAARLAGLARLAMADWTRRRVRRDSPGEAWAKRSSSHGSCAS